MVNQVAKATGRWGCACGVALLAVAVLVSYWAGRLHEDLISGVRQQEREIARISAFLDQDPERYGSLSFNRGPAHKFRLEGFVRSQDDLDDLQAELIRLFGEERTKAIFLVEVSPEPGEAESRGAGLEKSVQRIGCA
ncbi:hypothetical protein BH23PLA1_BH23PLA1_28560 [soil metagenome]